jgi:hypothetical protein
MVREYPAGGQPQHAEGGTAVQPLDLRDTTASLTQELSQLLAQSIAQGQAGKRAPGVAAAGSELANLAALVSASQSQRSHQPSFRDGLSSLSYHRPAQPMPPAPPPAPVMVSPAGVIPSAVLPSAVLPSAASLLVSEPHDDEPMPIPSTWRQPMPNDDERWYRQQLGAAGLGLLAGLIVVVPAVLWLSGWIGGPSSKAAARPPAGEAAPMKAAAVEVPQVKVRLATATADTRMPPAPETRIAVAAAPPAEAAPVAPVAPRTRPLADQAPPVVAAAPVAPPAPRMESMPVRTRADDLLIQAKRLIEGRDILGARELLQSAEAATSAPLVFMLAETYDPSMLAIWQVKPDGVPANPERARALYQRARDLGDTRAQQRLDWLR